MDMTGMLMLLFIGETIRCLKIITINMVLNFKRKKP